MGHSGQHDCDQMIEKVYLCLDGELSREEEEQFLKEIEQCSCCLDTYNIEKSFKHFLTSKLSRKHVNSNTVSNIKQKIQQVARPS